MRVKALVLNYTQPQICKCSFPSPWRKQFPWSPYFTNLPYANFNISQRTPRFFYATLNACFPRLMSPHFTIQEPGYTHVHHSSKGSLGCSGHHNSLFTLCNIATHEFLMLPPSLTSADSNIHCYYNYFLGFDPIKEVYKVLCISILLDCENNCNREIISHVFTLGVENPDRKWRTIGPVPVDLEPPPQLCLYINGALYWGSRSQETLTMFHINTETFETVTMPKNTKDDFNLVEIYASPALIVIDHSTEFAEAFDVWTMNSHFRGGGLGEWTRKRMLFPAGFNYPGRSLNYTGTLPTGEMMLAPSKDIMSAERVLHIFPLPIYV